MCARVRMHACMHACRNVQDNMASYTYKGGRELLIEGINSSCYCKQSPMHIYMPSRKFPDILSGAPNDSQVDIESSITLYPK